MPDSSAAVTDNRRAPFCYQTMDALAVIRENFNGSHRASAIGVYVTLTETANRIGGASARGGFSAVRKEIADDAGISVDTLDRYVKRFEEIGILYVERVKTGTVNHPNVWTLCDVSHAPPSRTHAATPSRTHAALSLLEERFKESIPYGIAETSNLTPAQTIIATFIDESRKLGSDPPSRVKGQVARLVGELLREGIAPERVRAGVALMLERRTHPSTLPSMVHEAGLPAAKPRRTSGGVTPSEVMAEALWLAEQGR